jgi:hypothetical protein
MYTFFAALNLLIFAAGQQCTDPSQLPGFSNLPNCAQIIFTCPGCGPSVQGGVDCETWGCVCDDLSQRISAASSAASARCTTEPWETASATSILNAFCAQLTVPASELPSTTSIIPQYTDPSELPGFTNVPECAQIIFTCPGCRPSV